MGGSKASFVDEQTDVPCWEQQVGSSEVTEFEKLGINITSKIYFRTDPGVTKRYQVLVTSRDGTAIADPTPLDVVGNPSPDVSVGRQFLFRVMVSINQGEDD
jgi:hypothetical protein